MPDNRPFTPTDKMKSFVYTHAKYGTPYEDIAAMVINANTGECINRVTLNKYFKEELRRGRVDANLTTAKTLFDQANGIKDKDGNYIIFPIPSCGMFWMKTRAGWREREKKRDVDDSNIGGQKITIEATVVNVPDEK